MADLEQRLLLGHVTSDTIPAQPSRIVRVFIASAGSDTIQERNVLVERVYPSVREYCRDKYGVEFQAVDLHWGNVDSHYPDDHSDEAFYRREIRRCQELSEGPNFLLLIGQKRGRCSLPASILYEEFRHLRLAMKRHKGRQNRNHPFLEQWYELNENSIPHTYILKPISSNIPEYIDNDETVKSEGAKMWAEAEKELRRLLQRGAELCHVDGVFDLETKNRYNMSDLESQAYCGIETAPRPDISCLTMCRNIIDLKNYTSDTKASNYTELAYNEREECLEIDPSVQKELTTMKSRIEALLPGANRAKFDVLWRYDDVINPNLHKEYLERFSQTVKDRLLALVDIASLKRQDCVGSETYLEVLQHWIRCKSLADTHFGRDDVIQKINQYLQSSSSKPLVLHGVSGAGKTSLMSKSSLEAENIFACPVITVTRYIGYTPQSSNLRQLLLSLCSQLTMALKGDLSQIPTDCPNLVNYFHQQLDTFPDAFRLLIFLDDISQLRPGFNAHYLTWLPANLKSNVRLVISTSTGNGGLLERLTNNVVEDSTNVVEVTSLGAAEGYSLLLHFFEKNNRSVTKEQKETLSCLLQKCSLPLYVKILTDFVSKDWVSSMIVSPHTLPMSLDDSVKYVFDGLEKTFGVVTVARCMCYLYASWTGLSDCEMQDVLSLDDTVLGECCANQRPLQRIPPSKWIQLKDTFAPFLSSKEHDGVTVNFLCHKIFNEFIKKRYLSQELTLKEVHSLLADYFLGTWANKQKPIRLKQSTTEEQSCSAGTGCDRLVPTQPHTFQGQTGVTRYNRRKYDQVPRHLYLSGRHDELNKLVLFNYDWIYNKTKALTMEQSMLDLTLNPGKETTLVSDCLRLYQSVIEKNINNLAAELTGHLLPHYRTHSNIRQLIRTCDRRGLKHNALVPVFAYHKITGSSLKYVLETKGPVDQCFLSADGTTLFAKGRDSSKMYACDAETGVRKDTLQTSAGHLHWTPDGKYVVVVDHITEKTVKIHRGEDGRFIGQLVVMNHIELKSREKYHMGPVCVSNDKVCLVVTTEKSFLCIADLASCTFLQIIELDNRSSVCSITSNGAYVFCNSGRYLLTYNLFTLDQTFTTILTHIPNSIAFTQDTHLCYVSNAIEKKVTVMHFEGGSIELVYKAVVEEWMGEDSILELKVSPCDNLLAIRGSNNLLVYHRTAEQVIAHFPRPSEALEEFRLPLSQYEEMVFTQMAFAGNSNYLFGTMFRNIYMWDIWSGNLMSTIQTAPGVIKSLLVSPDRGCLFTLIQGHNAVQCWSAEEIKNKVDPLDKLSDSVSTIRVTSDQSKAFVTCKSGEEIAVVEMDCGTTLDLLTHEGKVEDFAVSPDGNHVLVSTKPKWANCAVKLWDLTNREIISEFGNNTGYCVQFRKENALLLVCQQDNTFKAPYEVTKFSFDSDKFRSSSFEYKVPFLLSRPFVTADDRHLVMFTALDYMESKGMYDTPEVTVLDLKLAKVVNLFTPEDFHAITNMAAILDVRECPLDPAFLALIYLSECHKELSSAERIIAPQYGLLVVDIRQGSIRAMCEPFISPEVPINNNLLLSKDFSFAVDESSNIFDTATMSFKGRVPDCVSGTPPRLLVLDGKGVVYAEGSSLKVVRLTDMKVIVTCETHSGISALALCADDRTLMVGCNDGTLLCYIIIDPDKDDSEPILSALQSRQGDISNENELSSRRSSRVWDKVSWEEKIPGYSRPPSAKSTGPCQKELLERVKPVNRVRPTSDTFLYMNNKSATCSVM